MTASGIKWSNLCLVCCVAVVAMSRRRRIASITSWHPETATFAEDKTKGILGLGSATGQSVYHPSYIGLGRTLDKARE